MGELLLGLAVGYLFFRFWSARRPAFLCIRCARSLGSGALSCPRCGASAPGEGPVIEVKASRPSD